MVHRLDKGRPALRDPGRAGRRGATGGGAHARPTAGGPDPGQHDPSPQGAAARLGGPVRDPGALRVRSHPLRAPSLGGDKAGNWQRWYKENIPIAERLYLDYTTEAEE
jgi:hypothetical protein